MLFRSWALSKQGRREEGVSQIVEGLTIHKDTEGELARPYFLALLAEANLEIGKAEEGISAVAEALEMVNKNEERFFEGELHRLKGELLLALSHENQAGAEACFRQALEVARWQKAKSLELRTAMNLSWLMQKQDKKEEARKMLADIYDWFTEGFETADLKKAKTLLEELS